MDRLTDFNLSMGVVIKWERTTGAASTASSCNAFAVATYYWTPNLLDRTAAAITMHIRGFGPFKVVFLFFLRFIQEIKSCEFRNRTLFLTGGIGYCKKNLP